MSNLSPLFRYGVLSDPQYVDDCDGSNHKKTVVRRHRQSLQTLKEASMSFNKHSTACNIILGDILDGKAVAKKSHEKCMQDVLGETTKHSPNWHFVTGNHDLYCFSREHLQEKFIPKVHRAAMKESKRLYYDFSPHAGYRFVILDGFDVSHLSASSPEHEAQAKALLTTKNPNYAAGLDDWYAGLSPYDTRFVQCNGAIGAEQLRWLETTLQTSLDAGEKCIICCHIPTYVPSTSPETMLWNAEEVLALLHSFPNVVAYMAGHDHSGGYAQDSAGIHHIVPPAPLECAEGEVSYGTIDVFESHLKMNWTGKVPPRTAWPSILPLRSVIDL